MKKWIVKIPYAVIALAAVFLLAVMVKILSTPPAAAPAPAGPAWVENNAQALEATLAISTNPTEQAFIQSKLDQLRRIQAATGGSLQNAPEKPADICALLPTALPTPPHTPGVELFQSERYDQTGAIYNSQWSGEVNGQWVTALAGTQLNEPPLAAIWLFIENTNLHEMFPAPDAEGALQIASADGARLTLQDAAGTAFYFDVAARTYLTSPEEILPTLAPVPTNTPAPEICP